MDHPLKICIRQYIDLEFQHLSQLVRVSQLLPQSFTFFKAHKSSLLVSSFQKKGPLLRKGKIQPVRVAGFSTDSVCFSVCGKGFIGSTHFFDYKCLLTNRDPQTVFVRYGSTDLYLFFVQSQRFFQITLYSRYNALISQALTQ